MSVSRAQPGARRSFEREAGTRRKSTRGAIGRAFGAFSFAYAAALVWALIDTFSGVRPQRFALDCLGIATAAWLVPAGVLAVFALIVRAVVVRVRPLHALLFPSPGLLPGRLSALLLASTAVWAIDQAVGLVGQRSLTTQRFMAAIAAFAVVTTFALIHPRLTRGLAWLLERLPRAFRHPSVFLVTLSVMVVLWFLVAWWLEPDYVREIGWQMPASNLGTFVLALLGAAAGRRTVYVASLVAGLMVGVVVWHFATPPPALAVQAVENRGRVTPRLVALWTISTDDGFSTPDEVQACRPAQEVVPPEDIGTVEDGAPDIVFITVDGWRWDHSSFAADNVGDLTPRLSVHARRAAIFERAYSPASSTRQSFRSLFTGLYPGRVGAPETPGLPWAMSLPEEQPTIAAYLSAAGYETIAFISEKKAFPERYNGLWGFDEIDDQYSAYQLRHRYTASFKISHIIGRLARPPSLTEPPRFLWTHLIEPHYPFVYGPELPTTERPPYHERHNHSVRYVDQQLDRLLEFLNGRERKDDTWVILTADHGEAFGEHGFRRHGATVYEEEIHVPLIIWGPGVRPGRRSGPVSTIDLVPTILEMAGLRVPESVCGTSLMPTLMEGGEPEPHPIYAAALPDDTTDFFEVAWIDGDRKLILHAATGELALYDLGADADETKNLLDEEPDAGDAMVESLRQFYVDHGMDPADYHLSD